MFTGQTWTPRLWLGLLCWLGGMTGLLGCAGNSKDRLLPVEGKVMVGGKLLALDPAHARGTVILYPDKSRGNDSLEEPRGTIDSEGKFKITTGTKPGAAPGRYLVTVDAAKVPNPNNPYHSASDYLMPERYLFKDQSKLAFDVVENAALGAYDLSLDAK
jgi:hypothetical protein